MPNARDQRPLGSGNRIPWVKDGTSNLQASGCPSPQGTVPYSILGLFSIPIDTEARYRDCMIRQASERHGIPLVERSWPDKAKDKALDTLDKLADKIPAKGPPKQIIARFAGRAVVKLAKLLRDTAHIEQLQEAHDAYQTLHDAVEREINDLLDENVQVKNLFDAAIDSVRQRDTYNEAQMRNLLEALEWRHIRIREKRQTQKILAEEMKTLNELIAKVASQ